MGLLKKEQKLKVEGMKYASRLITEAECKTVDDCIKVLDSEIIKCGAKPNEFSLTPYELQNIKKKVYLNSIMLIRGCACWALREEFGFGRIKIVRFMKRFASLCDDLVLGQQERKSGYDGLKLDDIVDQLFYETAIDLHNEDKTVYDDSYDWHSVLKKNGYYKELADKRKRKKVINNGNKNENQ